MLDVYDHFAWRVTQSNPKMNGDGFLKTKPEEWQDKYFNADGDQNGAAEVLARRGGGVRREEP